MSYDLGKKLIKSKKFTKAIIFFQKILNDNPDDLRANFQMGKIFYDLNHLKKSVLFFKKCDSIQPNTPNILFNLALALQNTGNIKDARNNCLNLISENPKDVQSYYGLYSLNINNISKEYLTNLKELLTDTKISTYEKSLINFILSKIERKNGNINKEIEYLEKSHKQCYNAHLSFNEESNFYYNNIISNYFDKINFVKSFKSQANFNNLNHIFIIGLPRSGSSLVETIINHSAKNMISFGEFHGINTSILNQISETIYSKNFNSKEFQININQNLFQDNLIERYVSFENKTFIDKSLENFFNIEIILNFFPNAKFVHTYRNYNDAIIAIYQTMLPELSWSHRIGDIKRYFNFYKKTINYFKKKYPDKIIDVELSKLTESKEIEVKKILNFCEIEINKNFLDFDKNEKLFNKTNSFLQVREKIQKYDDKKYRPYYYLLD